MTHEADCTLPEELLEQIAQQRLDVLPDIIRTVINTAMQIERQNHLSAAPYERTAERRGRANGYKPKTVTTRVGQVTFDVPQVREGGFYPQSLEKGLRSERALKLALAEMYVQGVSTRKVAAITEQLCGTEISSTQVSRATAELDEQFAACVRPDEIPLSGRSLRKSAAGRPGTQCRGPHGHGRQSRGQTRGLGCFRLPGRA